MALVRKSNTRRNLILMSILGATIVGGGVWLYFSSQPIDVTTPTDMISGRRDIDKIREFNATDFDQAGLFGREDYRTLEPHGTPPTGPGQTGVINPFVPSQ